MAALRDFQRAFADAVTAADDDAEAGIRQGVKTVLRWCLDDEPEAARFLLTAADAARGAAGDELRDTNREFFAAVLGWWRPHVRAHRLRDLDLDLAHAIWLGPALEYCRLRLGGRTQVGPRRAQRELSAAAWQALRHQGDDR